MILGILMTDAIWSFTNSHTAWMAWTAKWEAALRLVILQPLGGVTNQAEFFAVASETFFEKPRQLKEEHAELFDLLVKYYQVNPANWA